MHTYAYALPFKSWNMRRNIITIFFLVSSYPINDWKLWLICFNETSIMNCSLINHNNPVLRALPFIQATAEVILHNYSKLPVFECGLWKRPIISRLPQSLHHPDSSPSARFYPSMGRSTRGGAFWVRAKRRARTPLPGRGEYPGLGNNYRARSPLLGQHAKYA